MDDAGAVKQLNTIKKIIGGSRGDYRSNGCWAGG